MTMLERPSQRHLDSAIHYPASDSLLYRRIRAWHVSLTNVKSRVGFRSPNWISGASEAICEMMAGMMARADWRGPYVLKGRATTAGRLNE